MERINNNTMTEIDDAVWIIESNVNFMDDGLAIMEELMQPLISGPMNEYKLIELTRSQVQALYGSLTYLQHLHETINKGIGEFYKATKAAKEKSTQEAMKSMEQLNKKNIDQINELNLRLEEAGLPID